jgi:hypothetical protein
LFIIYFCLICSRLLIVSDKLIIYFYNPSILRFQ